MLVEGVLLELAGGLVTVALGDVLLSVFVLAIVELGFELLTVLNSSALVEGWRVVVGCVCGLC